MLAKSKVKYFSYYFVLLPILLGILYGVIEIFVQGFLLKDSYSGYPTVVCCFILSVVILILNFFFKQTDLLKDISKYSMVLFASCVVSVIFFMFRFNLGFTNYCARSFDILVVRNVYAFTFVLTTITNFIFFYLIKKLNLNFTILHIAIFVCAMIVQFVFTHGFRTI